MYKTGKSMDELLKFLEEIDSAEVTRTVTLPKKQLQINIMNDNWTMETPNSALSSAWGNKIHGKGYGSLFDAISAVERDVKQTADLVVLALVRAEDGKYGTESYWVVIDPVLGELNGIPSKLDKNRMNVQFEYPIIHLTLSENEMKACESKLALWDEDEEILYPLQSCADESLNRMLGKRILDFSRQAPVPAGILLATLMDAAGSVRLLCTKKTETVYSVVSFAGARNSSVRQTDLFTRLFAEIQKNYIFHVENWKVSDERSEVKVMVDGLSAIWTPVIEIQVNGTSSPQICISTYARFGNGRIYLDRATATRDIKFWEAKGAANCLNGAIGEILKFAETFEILANNKVKFSQDMVKLFRKSLGKRRYEAISFPKSGEYLFSDILHQVLNAVYTEKLGPRWEKERSQAASKFFDSLAFQVDISVHSDVDLEERKVEVV